MDVHQNARLTPHCRALVVERVLKGRVKERVAAEFGISVKTVRKWVVRFQAEVWQVYGIVPVGLIAALLAPRPLPSTKFPGAGQSHERKDHTARRPVGLRARQRQLGQEAILAAAMSLLNHKGYLPNTTMQMIVDEAGVGVATVFRRFRT